MALPTPIPHPLAFFEAPGWLSDALEWVVGVDWPEGDEKAMRALADEWHAAGQRLGPLLDEADQAALSAVAAFGGPEGTQAQALLALWHKLGGGPESTMAAVHELLPALGNLVDAGANEIEGVKLEFYIELGLLLIELLTLIATAVLTFGGSLAGAGPVMLATRFAIQQILRRATKELLTRAVKKSWRDKAKSRLLGFGLHTFREALEEGAEELGTSGGVQAYQVSQGNRAGFAPKDLATAFGLGTLGGAVANVTSVGGVKATSMSGRFGEKAIRGAFGEMLAETSIGVVTGQGVTWTSLGMAASSATFGSVMGDGQHLVDGRLTSDFIHWTADSTPTALPDFLQPTPGSTDLPPATALSIGDPLSTTPAVPGSQLPPAASTVAGGDLTSTTPAASGSELLSTASAAPGTGLPAGASAVAGGDLLAAMSSGPGGDLLSAPLVGLGGAGLSDGVAGPAAEIPRPTGDTARLADAPIGAATVHGEHSPRASMVSSEASWVRPAPASHDVPTAAPPVADSAQLSAAGRAAIAAAVPAPSPEISPAGITPVQPAATVPAATVPAQATHVAVPATPASGPAATPAPVYPVASVSQPGAHYAAPPGASSAGTVPRVPEGFVVSDEPIVLHPWLLAQVPQKSVEPPQVAVVPQPVVAEDADERAYYGMKVREDVHAALTSRLLQLVDQLMADFPERRRELRENAIAALTPQDLESIADELWQIANDDSLRPRVRLTHGGLLDLSATSLATGRDYPPAAETSRRYDEPGGYRRPLALHQQDVELAMTRDESGRPQRFGDLNGEWLRRINDGGPAADLSRAINCTDVVLSVLDTWLHGRPRVAAPRTIDKFTLDDALRPLGGEPDGMRRIEIATGGQFESLPTDRPGFARLEEVLHGQGHGSCAVLVQQWPNGDSHATTVHNQNGEIFYVDAQRPEAPLIGGRPLGADRMQVLVIDPSARPVELGTGQDIWDVDPEGPPRAHSKPVTDIDRMMRDPTPEELAALGVGTATAADLGLAEADLTAKQRAELPRVAVLHPGRISFTQRSVSASTGDGVAATELERRLGADGWRGGPVHAILWGDGSLASLDHRRLRAALRANLDRVPVVIHAASDPISAWGEPGEPLADDLRRLPDGSWIVGGDEGEIIYPKGKAPTTCGEAALFRAGDQRSLLPGHLFGTKQEPVTLGRPPGSPTPPRLPPSTTATLTQARLDAERQADRVQADLESLGFPLHNLENRIKSAESLAHKGARAPLSRVNDILRFKLILDDGQSYTTNLVSCLETLGQQGYEVVEVRNYWKSGNRFYGVNAALRSVQGQLFELQFSSPTALRADDMTHELYEIVRRADELAARRIHGLLNIAAVNQRLGLPERVPAGLNEVYPSVDIGFSAWVSGHPEAWTEYETWLAENGRTFPEIVLEFGLILTQLGYRDIGREDWARGN
ncbi:hypothetical protein Rhe02_50140 [Rhizocola hellebori]|uniref:Tox-PL domain-containing protein n=1 Tax=Rhizocola hellebori TaxID=1392758 RepID=A0A8J3QBQ1_9ACTN|nr:toxin glutamine deamidase domain-containing protein [Rhizocola hellebori]GIH06947.1 hypothetical protein Rhe02_50140 [Rhizocola hellebori]